MQPTEPTPPSLAPPLGQPEPAPRNLRPKIVIAVITTVILVVIVSLAILQLGRIGKQPTSNNSASNNTQPTNQAEEGQVEGLTLDPRKNYGDKYQAGILPVGDDKYTTDAPKKGYIYMCNANFVSDQAAGATSRGPWFVGTTQWDINKKYSVRGSVQWQQQISNVIQGDKRVISTNNLPDHVTGTYPVAASDPAYAYDRNPNSIKAQSLTYNLAASPAYLDAPKCMGGEVGVMLTGSALFNGFDAGGRDAGAWEIQDGCEGHPQASGIYHYHTLSSCIKDTSVSTVIGFALDGFPITGPKVGEGNYLTTDDLDECHGIVSDISLDSKKTKTYHYVMTQDFPYSASCFRATASQAPGQHAGNPQPQPMSGNAPPPRQGNQPPPPR